MSHITTTNPATGEPIAQYPLMSSEQAEGVVQRCHEAFLDWRHRPLSERAEIINRIADQLEQNADALAKLMTEEMGKLLSQSKQEIALCAQICRYTAKTGCEQLADEERDLGEEGRGIITRSPVGVIYGIQPWNFPVYQVIRYSIANLMAGNGVLLKHAANVTGTGLRLAELYETAGLPEGLFGVLLIDHDQSEDIISHDHVRGVTLTGSTDAGQIVAQQAAKAIKKTVLELGSNDAYLVLEGADLEKAVEICVRGRTYNNGETCVAAKRFVVVASLYDDFKDAFVEAMSSLKVGDPTDEETDLGPMARADLRDGLHEQVTESVSSGARLLCGGTVPDGDGYFYPATVLADVSPGQPAYDDELFGPVASLIKAEDDADAIRIANDSRFGLGGGIITEDTERALELARSHFDTGMVFINGFGLALPNMPFGGVKRSGYGREHGGWGMTEFVNVKAIHIRG